ncbi:hypothetical protein [Pseudoalteromonas sp. M8]|uniref:hypothetical protein n=1 Tax=Pseudoalteromonas sp. M8 TaxID=2692624 RepID=UPI001BABC260|nr:hypothetical protein [Pseudoalteromonas sp. M8]QUI72316.1 hypothetical protein GSF13_22520 [Pseudoalteromonas sp. M8]
MINNYDKEYYIILKKFDGDTLYPKPLKKTAKRRFRFEQLTWGQEPLFFENAHRDKDLKANRSRLVPDVFLSATIPVVNSKIREKLKFFAFEGMQLYPAVYIDDEGNYHENFWCMNFWEELDCLDRNRSKFSKLTLEKLKLDPDADDLTTYKYSLDSDVLDKIPEEERLIFKMGPDDMGYVFVHQKIADIFFEEKATGVNLVKVSDFEEGMQF